MILSAKTDIGAARESNQDAFQCGTFSDGATWAVVCDGMGGVSGGQVASELCVERVAAALSKAYRKGSTVKSLKNLLTSAISGANSKIFDKSSEDIELKGMGTTVVATVINNGLAVIAHVGDSRAYLINDEVTRLTKDHSLIEFMLDTGKITPDEAKVHPERNIITRAVGIENFVDVDINIVDVGENDVVLLCTDGLSGSVEESDISRIIKEDIVSSSDKLITFALENGSRDNITAVVLNGNKGE